MTPLEIEILLACYVSPVPDMNIPFRIWHSQASKEVRANFIRAGMMKPNTFEVTDAGVEVVERLMSVEIHP